MEVSGQLHAPAALLPGEEPLVPILYEPGCASELVWKMLSTEESLASARNRTPAVEHIVNLYTDWAFPALPTTI
jgi:hypothetical protein